MYCIVVVLALTLLRLVSDIACMLLDIVSIANKYNIVVPLRHPSVAIVNKFLKLILRKLSQMIHLILHV